MISPFPRGTILLVRAVLDPQGSNPKDRPCLVIEPLEASYVCVAITTAFSPGKPNRVPLPWSRPQHARTGLWEPSAAACDWFLQVPEADVVERLGFCPGKHLLEVMRLIEGLV